MRIFMCLCLALLMSGTETLASQRYLNQNKVMYEEPDQSDVLNVYVAKGYSTVLELPEKPTLVSVGDYSLLQIEVPKNAKTIILKPMAETGQTNLFVFTPNHRFNYQVVISDQRDVDYVVDVSETINLSKQKEHRQDVPLSQIIRMVKDYAVHQKLGIEKVLPHGFKRKRLFDVCAHPHLDIRLMDIYSIKHPHVLVFHLDIRNDLSQEITLNESNTSLLVNDQDFPVDYVLFDQVDLKEHDKTNAYLILRNSHISLNNEFRFKIGVNDETYICR